MLSQQSIIRQSSDKDLRAIHSWLEEEEKYGVEDGFLCNWSVIEESHRSKGLLVLVDGNSQQPVAFQLNRLLKPGIIQVRNSERGKGYGRKLVEHCVKLAIDEDEPFLFIQCKPVSSIPFWNRMGFSLFEEKSKTYGYRSLEKQLPFPLTGDSVAVVISFYPENKLYPDTEGVVPYSVHTPAAKRLPNGNIALDQRVLFHNRKFLHDVYGYMYGSQNAVVGVEVDGCCIYLEKAKREKAEGLGFQRRDNGWFLDSLDLAIISSRVP